MKARKYFYLTSADGKFQERMTADDLISYGIPRSTAYRAIAKGTLPRHRQRHLQFMIFGDLPGWDGWRIHPGKITSPSGLTFDAIDLENLAYLKRALIDWKI